MRKKDLLKLNTELFKKSDDLQAQNRQLEKENEQLKMKTEQLIKELSELKERLSAEPEIEAEEPLCEINISEDKEYAAEIIGKIVLKSALHCTSLSSLEQNNATKELINLILGRTEIAKAEILKAVSEDLPFETKKILIDTEQANAEDYFLSVLAQKD